MHILDLLSSSRCIFYSSSGFTCSINLLSRVALHELDFFTCILYLLSSFTTENNLLSVPVMSLLSACSPTFDAFRGSGRTQY